MKFENGGEKMLKKRGFTLIELLIVVAIIAILAAIAVPNFLEAQVRSKVSRAKADIRSFATALEAYAVDHKKYIPDGRDPHNGATPIQVYPFGDGHLLSFLTTPIAYMTTIDLFDPFVDQKNIGLYQNYKRFRFFNIRYRYYEVLGNITAFNNYNDIFGEWVIYCNGPDKIMGPFSAQTRLGALWACTEIYDPTNGTVSAGDIMRCQKYNDNPRYW
jgi:prepilin-type N-terminal cleavage/methylation domain-containing protein